MSIGHTARDRRSVGGPAAGPLLPAVDLKRDSRTMGILDDRVMLVTGAGSGIGRAYAARFAREGAQVAVVDRDAERAALVAKEIAEVAPGRVLAVAADVTSADDNRRAVAETVAAFGRLDVFVGNAGVFDGFLPLSALDVDTIDVLFDRVFAVNVKGYVLGAKAAIPELVRSGGNMVFTASTAGFWANQGGFVYTMAKHAVVGLIRELAYELAPKVRVNGVAPGGTFTDLRNAVPLGLDYGDDRSLFDAPSLDDFIKKSTPLRRVNSPDNHAAVAAFLASADAEGLTGVIIHSDGGYGVRGAASAAGGDDL